MKILLDCLVTYPYWQKVNSSGDNDCNDDANDDEGKGLISSRSFYKRDNKRKSENTDHEGDDDEDGWSVADSSISEMEDRRPSSNKNSKLKYYSKSQNKTPSEAAITGPAPTKHSKHKINLLNNKTNISQAVFDFRMVNSL